MSSYQEIAISINLREIVNKIHKVVREVELEGGSEEDLKIRVEDILNQEAWSILKIPRPKYEYSIKGAKGTSIKHYRLDALYGLTIFEYKVPRTLGRAGERDKAVKKLREEYIPSLLKDERAKRIIDDIRKKGLTPRIAGVLLDGYNVVFVYHDLDSGTFVVEPEVGVYPLDTDRLRRIIRIVVASYKKRFDATTLASDFGFKSEIAQKAVKTLYNALVSPKSEKTKVLFEEWKKLVSYAYPLSGDELRKVAENYGFSKGELEKVDGLKLFYAIQTYYALILKLLAAQVAARFYDSTACEYIKRLREAEGEEFRELLFFLESGYVYKWFKIRNFLEGGPFGWYINEWNDEIGGAVKEIVKELDEYNVEALAYDPSSARDVFKLLYEELIPREDVRKYLGIYATPDWLAELVLDELGLSIEGFEEKGINPLSIKILDPGVGTGTFLSLIVQRIASYLRKKYPDGIPHEVAKRALKAITENIIGFDIDALALLTAKTNYLIALATAELLAHKEEEEIEIPVYMANSIITSEELKESQMILIDERHGKYVQVEVAKIPTTVGDFYLPLKLVESEGLTDFLRKISDLLEQHKPSRASELVEAFKPFAKDCKNQEEERAWLRILEDFYDKLLKLKERGIDEIWVPIIKSHIASTTFKGRFNYVVGNPPWIAYRYIADPSYQEKVKGLIAKTYELVVDEHLMTHMEMAALFFIRALDLYLREDGLIGFVMPRSLFSSDHHDKFRSCEVKGVAYELLKIIDCENVEPLFYIPTCAIIAKKGGKTSYPINASIVSGKLPSESHKVIPLQEARKYLKFEEKKLYFNKVGSRSFLDYEKVVFRARKSHYYKLFRQGATIVPQSCWFVDVIDEQKDFLVVKSSRRVKVRGKVEHEIPPLPIERRFIYGVLTSAEVMLFCHLPPNIAVLPIIPAGSKYKVITKDLAKNLRYNYLAQWLNRAEGVWNKTRGEKREKMTIYQRLDYQRGISDQSPNAKFKVVYLRSGKYLAATVVEVEKVVKESGKLNGIVAESTLYYYDISDISNEDEALYLTSILNSTILDELTKPMQSKGKFGERDIHKKPLEYPIPKYSPHNPIHKKLSEIGRKATEVAQSILPQILKEYGYDEKLKERGALLPQEVAIVRRKLRERLRDLISQIDALVLELLKGVSEEKTAQASLGPYMKMG